MSGQRNRSLSIESPINTVPELARIVRVVGENFSIKVKFCFIHESIVEIITVQCTSWAIHGYLEEPFVAYWPTRSLRSELISLKCTKM